MKILVAPDSFGGTLTAPAAAAAIIEGWGRHAPDDVLTAAAMADGGPGFVDVLHAATGGELAVVTVRGPLGDAVPVTVLHLDGTAYVESAQACGLHLADPRDPLNASTFGVGQAVAAAIDAGARRVVVGLGGSATNDGGAGLLAALGATADVALDAGPAALADVTRVDLSGALARLDGVELVIAADVDVTLLGMFGATKTFGPQKGLTDDQIIQVDGWLDRFVVAVCGSTPADRRPADAPGAGAAGGLGFALMLLGGTVVSGIELVAETVGLTARAGDHDLVVTGEGTYDFSSRAGKVVHGVAAVAAAAARPCIVLAGQVLVGSREMRAMGVESAYGVTERVDVDASMAEPARHLADLAERVARTWSPRRLG
ncbi:glycerate kinase family protein [Aeromicrobium fastidiosum]|uniref:Glycerate kinase n=1 Tax=Aeromicrobium fastidiosum TaxID=52699 RepID=A0A641AMY1_9ACTN|nr:glycerate kinase [Aeromicrobium fastidiosum]KAA1378638.1 glycerate kinase [Aeromicrobium fastidiosum]MBP2392381.1 glycerate kinase [Aeromicrobium fastidiosum]